MNIWSNLISVIFALALIIALIVLVIKFLGKRNRILTQGGAIRTLGAVGVGQNKSLQVVEIGDRIYLVGVGENITLLDKITDVEEILAVQQAFESEGSEFAGISTLFSGLISRIRKVPASESEELDETAFHEVFHSQLQKMPNRKSQMEALLKDEEQQSTDRLRDS
ncbi:flagellar biosynthetic protein FliO [Paenibacillus brevis]|uniref:flagellar biosynthetic protein FliO n=1 Tax=Paenibacillus brevis TaxID=2841508 RepID=UPI0032178372